MNSLERSNKLGKFGLVPIKTVALLLSTLLFVIQLSGCSSSEHANRSAENPENSQQTQAADNNINDTEKEEMRVSLQEMAELTVAEFISLEPEIKQKIEKAYGYAVFDSYLVNIILYVAGKGNGVALKSSSKEPIYMLMLRAGTGPGIGYTKMRQLLIIEDQETFDYMTSIGLDVQVSALAAFKIGEFGGSLLYAETVNPFVEVFTIVDSGIDLQANWGAVEYIKDWSLNEAPQDAE